MQFKIKSLIYYLELFQQLRLAGVLEEPLDDPARRGGGGRRDVRLPLGDVGGEQQRDRPLVQVRPLLVLGDELVEGVAGGLGGALDHVVLDVAVVEAAGAGEQFNFFKKCHKNLYRYKDMFTYPKFEKKHFD